MCDFAPFISKALSKGIPAVSWAFLEGDQNITFEVHRELFGDGGIFAVDHTGDDKEAVIEFFYFGSLIDVDDIFDDQRVKLEHICEAAQGGF